MSRIGRKPVVLPKGVELKVKDRLMTVKGPKGELKWEHPEGVTVKSEGGSVVVERANDEKHIKACHGLARSLVQNMVTGVSEGYRRVLEIVGVGYKAQVQGNKIVFSMGYSRPVEYELPAGIAAEVDKKQVVITLSGIDKQRIGQAAADIRAIRPPDSYKGKGIRYAGEPIKLKAGKTTK